MTEKKLREVISSYRDEFRNRGIVATRYPIEKRLPLFFRRSRVLSHCAQMLDQMDGFLNEKQDRREKVFRWLGFIQGALWVLRFSPVADLKTRNRPAK